jgi:hypothetical protein
LDSNTPPGIIQAALGWPLYLGMMRLWALLKLAILIE